MADDFDPDAYLADDSTSTEQFDPDAYLKGDETTALGQFARGAGEALTNPSPEMGLMVGGPAGWLAAKGEGWLLDHLGLQVQRNEQGEEEHPIASELGRLSPALLTGSPEGSLMERGVGAVAGAGMSAAQDIAQGQLPSPKNMLMGAATGAALPRLNKMTERLTTIGARSVATNPNTPGRPDLKKTVMDEQEAATPSRDQKGYTDPGMPAETEPEIEFAQPDPVATHEQMNTANDVTTTAVGVSATNAPAPQIESAGNPTGAPMSVRKASLPSEPSRNYAKDNLPKAADGEGQPSQSMSTAPIHEDVAAALVPDQEPKLPMQTGLAEAARGMSDEALDAHIGGSGQAPRRPPLAGLDPVEASQLTRDATTRAHEAVQARMREQQKGEAFTAAVTPEEQATIDRGLAMLREAKLEQVHSRISELEPEAQYAAVSKMMRTIETKGGESKSAAPLSAGGTKRYDTKTGQRARSKADAEKKNAAVDAMEGAVGEIKPDHGLTLDPSMENKAAINKHATAVLRRAIELNGGKEPTSSYVMRDKTPAYNIVRAARAVFSKPQWANMQKYVEALALKGETGKNVDADIAMKQRPSVEEAQGNETQADSRPTFEPIPDVAEGKDNSYVAAQNELREWVNDRSPTEYETLAREHDVPTELDEPADPAELLSAFKQVLAAATKKRPGRIELVPAEEGGVVSTKEIRTDADLPAGRSLDKNSPEFKAAAAAALEKHKGPIVKRETPEYTAAQKKANEKLLAAVDGTDKSALEHWSAFLGDEKGGVPIPQVVQDMADWMKTKVKGFYTPHADPAAIAYGDQIGMGAVHLGTNITRIKQNALAAARTALLPDGKLPSPADMHEMYRAIEQRKLGTLSQPLQDYVRDHVAPYIDRAGQAYDELRNISQKLDLPGAEEMPERKTNGAGFMDWMPRRRRFTAEEQDYDPVTNRGGLSNWTPSGQEREWFALQNSQTGDRMVYRVNAEGNVVFYKDHKPARAITPPASFDPRDIGASAPMKPGVGHNSNPATWIVDHANTDELMKHGNGEGGKPLDFHQNPVYVALDAYVGLKSAVARVKLLESILGDPDFKNFTTMRKNVAEEKFGKNNYTTTVLPQLKGRYLPKPMAWAFDDLVKTGFHYENSGLLALERFSQGALKSFFFFGPQVHVFNELDKAIIGRGLDNLNVSSALRNGIKAVKSVRMQDATQERIMKAGGNPMFAHALTSRLMPQIGKLVGEDMVTRPWKYDPIFKTFGVNTKDVLSGMMQKSNKFMWWQSDVLYTTLFNEAVEKGLSDRDAVKRTEESIDSYVVPTTFGKTFGLEHTDLGRVIQQFLTDPLTSNFGRFHYGVFKSGAHIVKSMLHKDSTMQDRIRGAGQAATLMAMIGIVYPALSAGYAKLTGNEDSEVERRGLSRMVGSAGEMLGGNKDPGEVARNVWSPSVGLDTVFRAPPFGSNKDFAGKKIIDQSGGWGRTPGQAAEFMLGQTVSPYKTISNAAQDGDAGYAFQRFLESNVGLKTPTDRASRYVAGQERHGAAAAKAREKNGKGLERLNNFLIDR